MGENASIDVPHPNTLKDMRSELSGEAIQVQVTPGHADSTLPSADQAIRSDAATSSVRESQAVPEDSAVPLAGRKTAQQGHASDGETAPTSKASTAPSTAGIRRENASTSPDGAQTEQLGATASDVHGIAGSNASSSLIEGAQQVPSTTSEDGVTRSKKPAKRKVRERERENIRQVF